MKYIQNIKKIEQIIIIKKKSKEIMKILLVNPLQIDMIILLEKELFKDGMMMLQQKKKFKIEEKDLTKLKQTQQLLKKN